MVTKKQLDELSYHIIGCAIDVHKELGPGLLESVYECCLKEELVARGMSYRSQVIVPIQYKGKQLDANLKLDLIVEELIIVELKAVSEIVTVHQAQLLTYMKLLSKPKGVIINFNCNNIFKEGQKTLVNEHYAQLP